MSSPWGKVDNVSSICRGVAWVSTPSHGGLRISKGFAQKHLSHSAIKRAIVQGGYLFFEEDCDFAIPALELSTLWPSLFPNMKLEEMRDYLVSKLSSYNPDYLLERGLEPSQKEYEDYKERQEQGRRRREKDPDLIVAAQNVNEETIKVWTADGLQHHVTAESYRNSRKDSRWINLLSRCELTKS